MDKKTLVVAINNTDLNTVKKYLAEEEIERDLLHYIFEYSIKKDKSQVTDLILKYSKNKNINLELEEKILNDIIENERTEVLDVLDKNNFLSNYKYFKLIQISIDNNNEKMFNFLFNKLLDYTKNEKEKRVLYLNTLNTIIKAKSTEYLRYFVKTHNDELMNNILKEGNTDLLYYLIFNGDSLSFKEMINLGFKIQVPKHELLEKDILEEVIKRHSLYVFKELANAGFEINNGNLVKLSAFYNRDDIFNYLIEKNVEFKDYVNDIFDYAFYNKNDKILNKIVEYVDKKQINRILKESLDIEMKYSKDTLETYSIFKNLIKSGVTITDISLLENMILQLNENEIKNLKDTIIFNHTFKELKNEDFAILNNYLDKPQFSFFHKRIVELLKLMASTTPALIEKQEFNKLLYKYNLIEHVFNIDNKNKKENKEQEFELI